MRSMRWAVCSAIVSALGALGVLVGPRDAGAQPRAAAMVPTREDRATEGLLFQLENDWARAVIRRDGRALRRLVAPTWVYSDESGVMGRDAGIAAFTTGTDTVREASNSEMRAIVYHGTAVVIGILQMKGSGPAGPFDRQYRYTDTWARLDGQWKCIASQDYLMPKP